MIDAVMVENLLVFGGFDMNSGVDWVIFKEKICIKKVCPHVEKQQPLVTVGKNLGITAMSLISSCEHSIKKFGEAAMQHHIYIGRILEIPKHSRIIGDVVKKFLDESEANETIGLLLEPEEIYTIVQYLRNYKSNNNKLLLGTIGLNKNFLKLWKNVFNGGYLIEPHMAELPDFRNYFLNVLQSAQKNDNKLVKEYISTTYDCNWNNTEVKGIDDCSQLEIKQLAGKLQIDLEVTFVVKAVSAFSAAVFLVQAQLCNENPLNCSVSHTNLQQDILATLSQLSFTSQHDAPFELQGTTLHITHDGQLVSNKYIIYHIQNNGDVSVAGWYSNDQGLVLNHGYPSSQDLFASHTKKTLFSQEKHGRGFEMDTPSKATINELINKEAALESFQDAKVKDIPTSELLNNEGSGVDARRVTPESSITRAWATVLVATAAVGTFIAIYVDILQDLVDAYNGAKHSSIKMAPADVSETIMLQSFIDDSKEFIVKELIVLSVCGTLLQHWVLKPSYVIEELSTTAKKQSNYIVNKLHGIPWDSSDVYYSLLESLISHATTRAETVYVKGAEKKKFLAKCMPCLRLT
uniref:Uncharacterized protein n=1 Tax=Timema monikensis TaxID=170555 RepID=A0A7R9HLD5_9NEOP|nr:unnamed protein product [Timema monikensis]